MIKNVLMIAYTLFPYDARVRREAEALANTKRYNVVVCTPREGKRIKQYDVGNVHVRELNLKIYQGKNKFRYIVSYFLFCFLAFWLCTIAFLRARVDVVHIHNMPDFIVFSAIIPRIFGKKLILDIHDSMPETYGAKFKKESSLLYKILCFEESISCRLAHKVICVNHPQKDRIVERGIPPAKIEVSMNVPDHHLFPIDLNKKINSIENDTFFKIVYHGTLANRLGVDLTIKAIVELKEIIGNITFYIIGDGDDEPELINLVHSLQISDNVKFMGGKYLEEIPRLIAGMDVGVISNRKNVATDLMLPVKMMEYIVLDIPVVAPTLRTIQYYFNQDMVTYFTPDDVDSLAGAILRLYQDEDLRTKQAEAARVFLDKYGWLSHQNDLIRFYDKLVDH